MPSSPAAPPPRLDQLDALRGLAMLWMTLFHFGFDLHTQHLLPAALPQDFLQAPFWTWQRTCIVSLFLLCAGAGQAAAATQQASWPRFWRRWVWVAGCALLVSIGSYLWNPARYIYFGVLHGIAVMLLLLRCLRPAPAPLLAALAALALAAPLLYRLAAGLVPTALVQLLDNRPGNVLGLVTRLPWTDDYVPLLPWLGVLLIGYLAGQTLLPRLPPQPATSSAMRTLAWLGRHSLPYYMLHQLVLVGMLELGMALWAASK